MNTISVKKILINTILLFSVGILSSCGGSSDDSNTGTVTNDDTAPDTFSFIDQNNVGLNTVIASNSITITGINVATAISISNGEYSIDGGSFTSAASNLSNNQTVVVRQTSSTSFSTLSTALLTVGTESAGFSLTTGEVGIGFNKAKGFNNGVNTLAATTDGSHALYLGGSFTRYNDINSSNIIRLKSDGTVDSAFNVGSGFNGFVSVIVATTDGSDDIYIGGSFTSYNGISSARIIRLNKDGSVDTAFNVGTGFNKSVHSIAIATDGSNDVYVGGIFANYKGTLVNHIVRLNDDGTIDTTFNVGTGFNSSVQRILIANRKAFA